MQKQVREDNLLLFLDEHTLQLSPHLLDLPLSEAIKGELESLFLDKVGRLSIIFAFFVIVISKHLRDREECVDEAEKSNFTRLCSTKSMLLTVNESFPGLVIRIHRDDKVYVNVQNEGDYGVIILEKLLALKPKNLDFVQAVGLPLTIERAYDGLEGLDFLLANEYDIETIIPFFLLFYCKTSVWYLNSRAATSSTGKLELMKSLGADLAEKFDVVYDAVVKIVKEGGSVVALTGAITPPGSKSGIFQSIFPGKRGLSFYSEMRLKINTMSCNISRISGQKQFGWLVLKNVKQPTTHSLLEFEKDQYFLTVDGQGSSP
ncbi:2-methylene-furan-3-one reductase [Vitis vinifera]|uniref:2-methylene-furan-3-one reductase n=1 Tax=Vitis vinifera TaxID=29760 RepID=A0A438C2N9_VITVI|nr:2-methylene-furan-3-one reductase [Vitis vinifera]